MVPIQNNWAALVAICGTVFAMVSGYSSIFSLAPKLVRDFGFLENQVGLLGGILMGAYFAGAVLNILWSLAADRFGRRVILLVTLVGIGASFLGLGLAMSYEVAIGCRVVAGAFDSVGVSRGAVASVSDKDSRAFNMGVLVVAVQLGFLVGPIFSGILAEINLDGTPLVDYPYLLPAFFSSSLCFIAFLLVGYFYFDENNDDDDDDDAAGNGKKPMLRHLESSPSFRDADDEMSDDEAPPKPPSSGCPRPSVGIGRVVLIVFLYGFHSLFGKSVLEAVVLWGSLDWSHGGLGLSGSTIGLVVGLPNAFSAAACLLLNPYLGSKLGTRNAALLGSVASVVFCFLLPTVRLTDENFIPEARAAALCGIYSLQRMANMLLLQNLALLMHELCPRRLRGIVNGFAATGAMICCAAGPIIVGAIISANDADYVGPPSIYVYGIVFAVLALLNCAIGLGLVLLPVTSKNF